MQNTPDFSIVLFLLYTSKHLGLVFDVFPEHLVCTWFYFIGDFRTQRKPSYCSFSKNYVLATEIILVMDSVNQRRRYNVTSSIIGWSHIQNDICAVTAQHLTISAIENKYHAYCAFAEAEMPFYEISITGCTGSSGVSDEIFNTVLDIVYYGVVHWTLILRVTS